VLAFLNRYYSPRRTLEQWKWEYLDRDPCTFLFIGRKGGRVVATQGMLREDLVLDGANVISGKSETSMLAEELRGTGVFKDMYGHYLDLVRKDGMDLVWGITTAVKVWRDKLGFQMLGDSIRGCALTIKPGRAIISEVRSNSSLKVRIYRGMKSLTSAPIGRRIAAYAADAPADYVDFQGEMLADELKRLYSDTEGSERVTLAMCDDLIGWRISRNPQIEYQLAVDTRTTDESWCLWGIDRGRRACVSDIWCKDEAKIDAMIRWVLHRCIEEKVVSLRFIGNIQNPILRRTHQILVGLGARTDDQGLGFFVKWLGERRELPEWEKWRVTGLWTEGYTY